LFARCPLRERANALRPQKRKKNVSLIGAIDLKGVITQISLIDVIDGLTFEAFISQKLVSELWQGAYVVMDNSSVHKGKEIETLIEAVGAKLVYLPPYSPDFSPSENCWSKIKSILRSIGARNYPDLAKAVEEAFNKVSINDIRSWFTHCCYRTSLD
jgi:transposase